MSTSLPLDGVSAVIFDLDGTLRHDEPPGVQTFHHLAGELGIEITPQKSRDAERWTHAYWASSAELKEDAAQSNGHRDDLWRSYSRRHLRFLGVPEEEIEEKAQTLQLLMQETYRPADVVREDVRPTLEILKRKGFRLALLSNRRESYDHLVDSLGLGEAFELTLAAGEFGKWKPDHRVFLGAAEALNVRPDQSIYVGDNYFADVLGSEAAGMTPVLMDPEGLYPEVDCITIRAIGELTGVLALPD